MRKIVRNYSKNGSTTVKLVAEKDDNEKSNQKSKRRVFDFSFRERNQGRDKVLLTCEIGMFPFIEQLGACEDAPTAISASRRLIQSCS